METGVGVSDRVPADLEGLESRPTEIVDGIDSARFTANGVPRWHVEYMARPRMVRGADMASAAVRPAREPARDAGWERGEDRGGSRECGQLVKETGERSVGLASVPGGQWRVGFPQKAYLSLASTLRGGATAVPEKRPAKLITFSRSVRLWPEI